MNKLAAAKAQCKQLFKACRNWLFRLRSMELQTLFEIEYACLLDLVERAHECGLLDDGALRPLKEFLSDVYEERHMWSAAFQNRYLGMSLYTSNPAESSFRTVKRDKAVSLKCELPDLYRADRELRERWRKREFKRAYDQLFKKSNMELGSQAQCIKDAFHVFEPEYAKHFTSEFRKAEKLTRIGVNDNTIEVQLQGNTMGSSLSNGGFTAAQAAKLDQLCPPPFEAGEAKCGLRFTLANGDIDSPWLFYLPKQPFAQYVVLREGRLLCQACVAGGEHKPCQQAREKGGSLPMRDNTLPNRGR